MKLYVQHSQGTARDWTAIDHTAWAALPKKARPGASPVIDDAPGWIHALCILGSVFTGYDHYWVGSARALNPVSGSTEDAVRVVAWKDDPKDYPPGEFFARDMLFFKPAPDRRHGGAVNTCGLTTLYCGATVKARQLALGPVENNTVKDWSGSAPPPEAEARHGVLTSDRLHAEHEAARTRRGWRQWGDGVDPKYLDRQGRIAALALNKPRGTITYFQIIDNLANAIHAAQRENQLSLTAGASELENATLGGDVSGEAFAYVSPTDAPGSAAWPTGGGVQAYEAQLDVDSVGVDITFGLRAAGTANGHFARVNSGITTDLETHEQSEALFASPAGLKLASYAGTWTAGNASDRFEILVAATRAASHGNQSLTLAHNADAFARGPWAAASGFPDEFLTRQFDPTQLRM